MILVAAMAIVAASVPLTGGSLARLGSIRWRYPWTVAAALVIQVLVISVLPGALPAALSDALVGASYAAGAWFVVANRRVPGMWLAGLGGLSNLVAIGANRGIMPALPAALAAAGRARHSGRFANSAAVAGAHLKLLGDVFAVPRGWPLANVFSVGDVLLVAGGALLLHRVCGSRLGRVRLPAGRYRAALAERWARRRSVAASGASSGIQWETPSSTSKR